MAKASGRRIAAVVACVLAVATLLPVGARAVSSRWQDDSLWANSLQSLGVPLALTVFRLLDWYRGWPRGDGWALASVAAVTAVVFAVSARPSRRRLAAWL